MQYAALEYEVRGGQRVQAGQLNFHIGKDVHVALEVELNDRVSANLIEPHLRIVRIESTNADEHEGLITG